MYMLRAVSLLIALANATPHQSVAPPNYQVAPDHSLALAAYIEKGMPANDREWIGSDYVTAAAVLEEIGNDDPTTLPRYQSAVSGAMFARMVSSENYARIHLETISRQTRFYDASEMLRGLSRILLVYNSATNSRRLFDSEEVELLRFILEVSRGFVQFVNQGGASAGQAADSLVIDRDQLRKGLTSILSGDLRIFTEKNLFRPAELLRHADTLTQMLPDLFPLLSANSQLELKVRLDELIKVETDPALKDRLIKLAAVLPKAKAHNGATQKLVVPEQLIAVFQLPVADLISRRPNQL
jgi:hypothetical protein